MKKLNKKYEILKKRPNNTVMKRYKQLLSKKDKEDFVVSYIKVKINRCIAPKCHGFIISKKDTLELECCECGTQYEEKDIN